MAKSAFVRARIEPELKDQAEKILSEMGITPTQAINMLYKKLQRTHELPIDFLVPNQKTADAIEEARQSKGIVSCKDAEEMFKQLDI
ncbi:MAG: type II toxin-antitoxin system RelB/DinJ family antitoxin [Legionellales bacterium]|nr:type II toxin-antitoxin system RelB/DinJ family antitoxin [Legionellales bacterium]